MSKNSIYYPNKITEKQIAGFCIFLACFLFILADRDGYEGDDLNIICTLFNLEDGLKGYIDVYRYPWQPLGYWIGATVYKLTGSPTAIFIIPPLSGVISLTLIAIIMSKAASQRHSILFYVAILILMPELWFSSLYFNTSIIAMPFAVFAAFLLRGKPTCLQALSAGLFAGVAVLIRLDFVLVCPMLAVMAWSGHKSLKPTLSLTLAVCMVLALALVMNLVTPDQIINDYQKAHAEMIEKGQSYGWNLYSKLWIIMMSLHPAGWLLLLLAGPYTLIQFWRNDHLLTLGYGIATVFLLLPLPNLLSVKYLLPLMIFLPVFFVHCLEHLTGLLGGRSLKSVENATIAIAIIALTVSIDPLAHAPFVHATVTDARQVNTHDGKRSFGAYLYQMLHIDRMAEDNDHVNAAKELLQYMQKPTGSDVLIAGDDSYFANGSVGWNHFQLLAENTNIHGSIIDGHLLLFNFGSRHLWVSSYPEQALKIINNTYHSYPLYIDLRDNSLSSRETYSIVKQAILN